MIIAGAGSAGDYAGSGISSGEQRVALASCPQPAAGPTGHRSGREVWCDPRTVTWDPAAGGAPERWPPYQPVPQLPSRPPRRGIDVPGEVVKIAVAAMAGAYVLSGAGAVAGTLLVRSTNVVAVVLSSVGLYTALVGTCLWVSRRHGSGSVRRDLGLVFDRRDLLPAVGYAVAARLGIVIVSSVLFAIHRPLARGNLEGVDLRKDVAASVLLAVMAVAVAPVCEELFFRGVLLRALSSMTGRRAALGVQAGLFGLMHAGAYGLGNVGVVLSTAVVGLVLGHVAERQGRLGTAVLTHAVHNGASLLLLLAITG
jgi:membrane protease YdiL (CAAX protease family)